MPRPLATSNRLMAPTAPTRRQLASVVDAAVSAGEVLVPSAARARLERRVVPAAAVRPMRAPRPRSGASGADHPLTDALTNQALRDYDNQVKDAFDRIVPVLKRIAAVQHEPAFIEQAQKMARSELGFELPLHLLDTAWVSQLDMRTLFAWCVFQTYELTSAAFFDQDPLGGQPGSSAAEAFNAFLLSCGFHLLDITPCADGRLAHAIAYALRLPFASVRRRSHAGAMFDVENTVNRWVKTENHRYREAKPNPAHEDTRYLKVVLYHFSSRDPAHEGCAAHGSDDVLAAGSGLGVSATFSRRLKTASAVVLQSI